MVAVALSGLMRMIVDCEKLGRIVLLAAMLVTRAVEDLFVTVARMIVDWLNFAADAANAAILPCATVAASPDSATTTFPDAETVPR